MRESFNPIKPNRFQAPPLTNSEFYFIVDFADASSAVSTVQALSLVIESCQDPATATAYKILKETCIEPWLRHVQEIHRISASEPEFHDLPLPIEDGKRVSIGSIESCDVVIRPLPGIVYAHIVREGDGWKVSLNKPIRGRSTLKVGDTLIEHHVHHDASPTIDVKPGDVIEIGLYRIRLHENAALE